MMTLPSPPRRLSLTGFGSAAYVFLVVLILAMLLGPALSFFIQDRKEHALLERGVLTRFEMTASRQTHYNHLIDYNFDAPRAPGAAPERMSLRSSIDDEDYVAFADPKRRFVLYDPANPENAVPVTSRSALARRRAFDHKFAMVCAPVMAATFLLLSGVMIRHLRRKLRLLRFGVAISPTTTQSAKSNFGQRYVTFEFFDHDGKRWEGRQFFNIRIGIGGDFTPYMKDSVVFYDPADPRRCELFLPRLATFMFVKS